MPDQGVYNLFYVIGSSGSGSSDVWIWFRDTYLENVNFRPHFQIRFLVWNCYILIQFSWRVVRMSPLSKPVMAKFTDVYMRHFETNESISMIPASIHKTIF